MKSDKPFPSITDFCLLLSKSENKVRLQEFLKNAFRIEAQFSDVEYIYTVVGEYSTNLSTGNREPDFLCMHGEADTALFYIYDYSEHWLFQACDLRHWGYR